MKHTTTATVERVKGDRGLNRGGGKTRAAWQVSFTDAEGQPYEVVMCRKWGAEDFASWVREGNWDGTGCAELHYACSDDPRAERWIDADVRCPFFL